MKKIKKLVSRSELVKQLPHNAVVAEIGVARGDFSQIILINAFPRKLYLIDSWAYQDKSIYPGTINPQRNSQEKQTQNYNYVLQRFNGQIQNGQVLVHKGYSMKILNEFPNNYFDWVYIDANHQYKFVRKDLELCRLKVKEGGLICGHDYCEGNPITEVKYGVIQAVNEFCEKHGWRIVCLADNFWKGINFKSYVLVRNDMYTFYNKKFNQPWRFDISNIKSRLKRYFKI